MTPAAIASKLPKEQSFTNSHLEQPYQVLAALPWFYSHLPQLCHLENKRMCENSSTLF